MDSTIGGEETAAPSFRGVLPQLVAAVDLLIEQRTRSGIWADSGFTTSEALRAIAAYHRNLGGSDATAKVVGESAVALSRWLLERAREVDSTTDLYPGLDARLKGMCGAYAILRALDIEATKDVCAEVEPSMLKLLDAASQYATALGDLAVAHEVVRCIEAMQPPAHEAGDLLDPWLKMAIRSLLAGGNAMDRGRALAILLDSARGRIAEVAKKIWEREAPLMGGMVTHSYEEDLRGHGAGVLGELEGLEGVCIIADAEKVRVNDTWHLPTKVAADLVESFTATIVRFRSGAEGARAASVGTIAEAVRILSESEFAMVVVFGQNDEERIRKGLALSETLKRKEATVVSYRTYKGLEAIALVLIIAWAATFGWFNRDFVWLSALVGALLMALVGLAFRGEV